MEKKVRYCPSCGNKTNDHTCEICGRKTKFITSSYEEEDLKLIKDDVAFDHIPQIDASRFQYKSKSMFEENNENLDDVKKNAQRSFTHKRAKKQNIDIVNLLKKGLFLILFTIGLIIFAFHEFKEETVINIEDNPAQEEGAYYEEGDMEYYLKGVDDSTAFHNLTASIAEEDGERWIKVVNDSPYVFKSQINDEDNGSKIMYLTYIEPYATYMIKNDTTENIFITPPSTYDFTFHKPDVSYRYISKSEDDNMMEEEISVVLHEKASTSQIEEILKHMYGTGLLNHKNTIFLSIYQNEIAADTKLYNAQLNFDDQSIHYEDLSYAEIQEKDLDMDE